MNIEYYLFAVNNFKNKYTYIVILIIIIIFDMNYLIQVLINRVQCGRYSVRK